jgi:opacity protein-like surface antigen
MTSRRLGRAAALSIGLAFAPLAGAAQAPSSHLGLAAVGAAGLHVGYAQLERSSTGHEVGVLLDVGWMRGRGVRLQAEVSFLRATLTETVSDPFVQDSTFHGDYYDLTAGVSAVGLLRPDGQVSPYGLAGIGVHALSSTFGSPTLDARYNANRFGSHFGVGVRYRIGSDSRQVLYAEARYVIADEVDRAIIRVGALMLFADLY